MTEARKWEKRSEKDGRFKYVVVSLQPELGSVRIYRLCGTRQIPQLQPFLGCIAL